MAVDTASKRLSILFGETLPVPSGSFVAGDRLHLLELYSGLATGDGGSYAGPTYLRGVVRARLIEPRRTVVTDA
mgnify:CR=1 FL=1